MHAIRANEGECIPSELVAAQVETGQHGILRFEQPGDMLHTIRANLRPLQVQAFQDTRKLLQLRRDIDTSTHWSHTDTPRPLKA